MDGGIRLTRLGAFSSRQEAASEDLSIAGRPALQPIEDKTSSRW
jgi:hypothetical protein